MSSKISLVLPAYQEERRVGATVASICAYLDVHHQNSELIVVCDGCTDKTAQVARDAAKDAQCDVRVIELPVNQGKGAAVRHGVLAADGDYIFFTDADLSYSPEIMEEFIARLDEGADIAIAQRKKNTVYPTLGRRLLAMVSRFIVGNFIVPGIRDTQAGFKGFRREAAHYLFPRQRIKRFLFDLEILAMARRRGYKIEKVYVQWEDRAGSTVRLYVDTARSIRDLALIMFWSTTGSFDRAIAQKQPEI